MITVSLRMRWLHLLWLTLKCLIGAAALVVLVQAVLYLPTYLGPAAPPTDPAFTRAEFITIILASVSAILTALAIMLAVAAVVGYRQLEVAAKGAASAVARQVAEAETRKVAEPLAARVASEVARQVSGDSASGDEIAKAVGGEDAASR